MKSVHVVKCHRTIYKNIEEWQNSKIAECISGLVNRIVSSVSGCDNIRWLIEDVRVGKSLAMGTEDFSAIS